LIVLPLLAVAVALGLDSFSKGRWVAVSILVLVVLSPGAIRRATTYDQSPEIPFSSLEIPGTGPVVDLLGMSHRTALSLQTAHRRPIAEPLLFRRPEEGLQLELGALARGKRPDPALWTRLRQAGFEQVLLADRFGDKKAVQALVEEALGPTSTPGVYGLSAP